jgi:hypothetical protein
MIVHGLVVLAAILVLAACRRLTSVRLFQVATFFFAWTAASLFLELPQRGGNAARLGWYGILVGGPLAIALAILAIMRYSRESRMDGKEAEATVEAPKERR